MPQMQWRAYGQAHVPAGAPAVQILPAHEYQIHEVASDLDEKTSAILEQYTTIIYD